MESGFDFNELSDFKKEVLQLAKEDFPRESKKMIKKSAQKLAKLAKSTAQSETKKKTGNYIKGFKAGKVYFYGGDLSCRAYNASPHAHLIEYGHNQVGHKPNKKNIGFTAGKYPLTKASNKFERIFEEDLNNFLDEILDKGIK